MADMVNITVDGVPITAPEGTLLIRAAKQAGIEIPIFCHEERLEPVGACRMCIVNIEGMPKPQPACTTRITEGMIVHTRTPEVKQMWESVLEFLLINHPLDCPVCDRGGECPLQDNTYHYGPQDSRFTEEKVHFEKPVPFSPLIVMDRERCIMCFRCIRFQKEIAGQPEIQALDRGEGTYIDIFPDTPFQSKFSGNTVEICPVGALLSSVFRFRARPWEIKGTPSVCPNCATGCNIRVDVRDNREVVRYLSRQNKEVDDGWLCDWGRFDSDFMNSPQRLTQPLIRKDGELQPAEWDEALSLVADELKKYAPNGKIGALGSIKRTNEENYLLQKIFRAGLGTNNIDYKIAERPGGIESLVQGYTDGTFRGNIRDLDEADTILVIGSDVSEELPVVELAIKRATRRGAGLVLAYPLKIELTEYASSFLKYYQDRLPDLVTAIADTTAGASPTEGFAGQVGIEAESYTRSVDTLRDGNRLAILISQAVLEEEGAGIVLTALKRLMDAVRRKGQDAWARVMVLTDGTNAQGAMDMGLIPGYFPGYRKITKETASDLAGVWKRKVSDRPGMSGWDMIQAAKAGEMDSIYILGQDPASDLLRFEEYREALGKVKFLVVQDFFLTETAKLAHVVLPSCTFAETMGTYTNTERRIQLIRPAMRRVYDSRPDTEILASLSVNLGYDIFQGTIEGYFREIGAAIPYYHGMDYTMIGYKGRQWT